MDDTTSTSSIGAATAAAVITHKVENYDAWRTAFEAHSAARKQAGIVGHHVNRSADDPNVVSVYVAARDQDALRAFAASPDLAGAMKQAGVIGTPEVVALSPQENHTVRRRTAGAIITHEVADYGAWKAVFDQRQPNREQAGIVGYSVNRQADHPNTVVVYLQAESIGAIKAFASSPDLQAAMRSAGSGSPPQINYVQGEDWATYE